MAKYKGQKSAVVRFRKSGAQWCFIGLDKRQRRGMIRRLTKGGS